jgi:D-alanyl-D-alanine carboxypeptidase
MTKITLIRSVFVRTFSASVLLALAVVGAISQSVADIDAIVQKAVTEKAVPSAAVAVVKDGKVVLAKAYGSADTSANVTADENTLYQLASVTKQFTATAIMMLAEEGKLSVNDTLGKHLPDVPAAWRGVTIRQMMNQVSGIPSYTEGGKLVSEKTYTSAEILGLVKDTPMLFAPGERFHYSNTNYYLLGMIIEKASGKSYADFMKDRIFKPLGMTSTAVNTSGLKLKNAALGHANERGTWTRRNPDNPSQPWAAGAIVSSAADMAKWAAAQGDGKLLKKASWDEMWSVAKLTDGKPSNYGFGWSGGDMGGERFWQHGGSIAGFQSTIMRFPDANLSVVVLANTNGRAPELLSAEIAGLYIPKVSTFVAAQRAAANAKPIEDTDPETTKFLRASFEKMITAEISPDVFDEKFRAMLFPDRIKELGTRLAGQGAIKSFELMRAENTDAGKRRSYRITFENGLRLSGNFAIDAQGKIAGAGFRPEQ